MESRQVIPVIRIEFRSAASISLETPSYRLHECAVNIEGECLHPHYESGTRRGKSRTMRWMLRSKIHQATVTEADLKYVGSITIDEELMDMVGLIPGERVLVVSNTSGARLETYTIPGPRGCGDICMNGAAAHLIKKGDEIIIMGFELTEKPVEAKQIVLGPNNEFVSWLAQETYHTCLSEMVGAL